MEAVVDLYFGLNSTLNASVALAPIKEAVDNGSLGNLTVNPASYKVQYSRKYNTYTV